MSEPGSMLAPAPSPRPVPPAVRALAALPLVAVMARLRARDGAYYVGDRYVSPQADPMLPEAARHRYASRLVARALRGDPAAGRELLSLFTDAALVQPDAVA